MNAIGLIILLGALLALLAAGGGIFSWVTAIVAVVLALAHLATVLKPGTSRAYGGLLSKQLSVEQAYVLLAAFILIMLVPMPLWLSRIGGSTRYAQNLKVLECLSGARAVGYATDPGSGFVLTRNVGGTLRILAVIVCAYSAAMLGATLTRRWKLLYIRTVAWLCVAVAIAGTVGRWIWRQGFTLWWVIPVEPWLPGPIAGFISPNHYAGFLAVGAALLAALLTHDSLHRRLPAVLLDAAGLVVLSLGVVASLSRGGLLALIAGLVVVAGFSLKRRHLPALVLLLMLAGVSAGLTWRFANPVIRERLDSLRTPRETESYATRTSAWMDCLRVWRHYPLLGAGPNAFRVTFPQHRTTSESGYMTHAENEYIQWLAEGGVLGVTLACLLALTVWRRILAGAERATRDPVCLTAVAGATAAAAAHSLCDFPLHLPVYAVLCASVIGTGFAANGPGTVAASRRLERLPLPALLTVGIALLLAARVGDWERLDLHKHLSRARLPALTRALRAAPTSSYIWYRIAARSGRGRSRRRSAFAVWCHSQAVAYDPQNYRLWLSLGKRRLSVGDYDGARAAFERVRALRTWVKTPRVPAGRGSR